MPKEMVNIVGAGLAGSLVARLLRIKDYEVRIFDDHDPHAASPASSNLFIDHWLKKFSANEARNGVRVIEQLFSQGQIENPFETGMGYAMKVRHIPQRHVLVKPHITDKVIEVTDNGVITNVNGYTGKTIVCTGYRGGELIDGMDLDIKVGHCFFFSGQLDEVKSRLAIISPYKHEKLYQYDEGVIYYADSVALKLSSYEKRKEELRSKTMNRARKHIGDAALLQFKVGYRPMMKGYDFGRLQQHNKNIWSINGGGKNGLIAYADLADQFLKQLEAQ